MSVAAGGTITDADIASLETLARTKLAAELTYLGSTFGSEAGRLDFARFSNTIGAPQNVVGVVTYAVFDASYMDPSDNGCTVYIYSYKEASGVRTYSD